MKEMYIIKFGQQFTISKIKSRLSGLLLRSNQKINFLEFLRKLTILI